MQNLSGNYSLSKQKLDKVQLALFQLVMFRDFSSSLSKTFDYYITLLCKLLSEKLALCEGDCWADLKSLSTLHRD